MVKINLNGKWKVFNGMTGEFTGKVPGCVTTDLINAGKVYGESEPAKYGFKDGIYYGKNAEKIQWIERENFLYEKHFKIKKEYLGQKANLIFECLDTYANITLNGFFIGRTDDMHIKYEFDVEKILKEGDNSLQIEFLSPVKQTEELPKLPAAFTAERLYTRRMQCTYGWDWVYRFVTCGIERPCYIEIGDNMAVDNVYIYTLSADTETAQVKAVVKMKNFEKSGYATTTVVDPDGNIAYKNRRYVEEEYFTEYINIDYPKLWFPNGYGKQPLYTLTVAVTERDANGNETEECMIHTEDFGVRTVKIIQKKDVPGTPEYEKSRVLKQTESGKEYDLGEDSSSFTLCINGRKILCRGGNWVPCEPYISDESDKKITKILTLAKKSGLNMIRIWGGGVFEKDHFYSECDRLGILVTQDFLMACGKYPEEKEQFIERLSKEAECAAIRLRNHPCLVWWSGDNENAVNGYEELEKFNGRSSALKGIAPVLRNLDYNRHFLPSSPYGGKKYASKTVGTTHNTQFLGYFFPYMLESDAEDYKENYKKYLARFIAEEPALGAVRPETLAQMMTEEEMTGSDETMWHFHTQSNPALSTDLYTYSKTYAEHMLGKYADGEDRLFKLRYIQCEWMRIGMEMVRRNMFYSSGIIYWMLDDCWPASSGWAFIDYYCRPKDSYYAFKRCAGNIVASIDENNGKLSVYLSNTGSKKLKCTLKITKLNFKTGKIISEREFGVSVGADTASEVLELEGKPGNNEIYVADVVGNGKILYRTFYKNGALHMKNNKAAEIIEKGTDFVKVKASAYVQSLFIDGDYCFDDNCFVMLPGEERTVRFTKNQIDGRDAKTGSYEIKITAYGLE